MALRRHQIFVLAVVWGAVYASPGVVFHRSFRNGYPSEWNVSKAEATDSFRIGPRGTTLSDGRGRVMQTANKQLLEGMVIRVASGDELILQDGRGKVHRVRLFGIAAPREGQLFAAEACARLLSLVKGQFVGVECLSRDRNGILTGIIYQDEDNINLRLVQEGYAWAYRYGNNPRYLGAQNKARAAKRGLWRDTHPTAPWIHAKRFPPPRKGEK